MSKRYGRNQKRRARERIQSLESQCSSLRLSAEALRSKESKSARLMQFVSARLREVGADMSPMEEARSIELRLPEDAREFRLPVHGPALSIHEAGALAALDSIAESVAMRVIEAGIERSAGDLRGEVHAYATFGSSRRAVYTMSDQAFFEASYSGRIHEEIARRLNEELHRIPPFR